MMTMEILQTTIITAIKKTLLLCKTLAFLTFVFLFLGLESFLMVFSLLFSFFIFRSTSRKPRRNQTLPRSFKHSSPCWNRTSRYSLPLGLTSSSRFKWRLDRLFHNRLVSTLCRYLLQILWSASQILAHF